MPNSAYAFMMTCLKGRGGPSVAILTFFIILSVVSTAVGTTEREREGGRERKRETCKGIHERKSERGVIKTFKGIHELCSIMVQRVWPLRYLYRRMEATRYRALCVAAVEASRDFFFPFFLGTSCAGSGGYAARLFILFSFSPCKVVFSGWQPIR